MRIQLLSWLFLIPLLNILFGINPDLVSGQCLNHQLLLQLKNGLKFNSSVSTKLINWNQSSTDCCYWSGVTCDGAGRVIGLDLSSESISAGIDNSSALFSFEFLQRLNLANNNFNFISHGLENLTSLTYLNLAYNNFNFTQIPHGLGNISRLTYLNLSNAGFAGQIPEPPELARYVDYSSNNFSSFIPSDIGAHLGFAYFFSLSNNSLTGVIPESICNASYLQVLDFSNNQLNGTIPPCLVETSTKSLGVLNLQNNKLSGNISRSFPHSCALKTLDFNGNHLEGQVPQSLAQCVMLEVLNLGNNNISDNFPCFLKNSSTLRVLVLRSNRFQGGIHCQGDANNSWPSLQIIDLAFNNFSGNLPGIGLLNWRAMILDKNDSQSKLNHLRFELNHSYYQQTVTVTIKGVEVKLVKILTLFTSIDFSSNSFQGKIPETVGNLTALILLNLSHNALTGSIPSSIGNLKQLESLDLSMNKLNGVIPTQLATLTFLSVLNLSYNLLDGWIPAGSQFQTFENTSFLGNKGLCGPPLTTNCRKVTEVVLQSLPTFEDKHSFPQSEVYVSAALGFVVGFGIIIGPLLFYTRWRIWYFKYVDRVLSRNIIGRQEQRKRNRGAYRNPIKPLKPW